MKTILFDLDGTLLKMDVNVFAKAYFDSLINKYGSIIEPKQLFDAIVASTMAMYQNDGTVTNEEIFLKTFNAKTKQHFKTEDFLDYYQHDFLSLKDACMIDNDARTLIDLLKQKGYRLVLATNPIFPRIATLERMGFVNLHADDFIYISSYENSHHTKPSLAYYHEVLDKIGEQPENCLMIGNDLDEDMVVNDINMDFILLNDCMLNKHNKKPNAIFNGSIQEFIEYAKVNL